ncbi:MAG: hypothetical protein D6723_02315 [Acidobacteria bacterium]|nr:MAG: hypothetical protein D6723_02315 [Acidobacteriota bacterium]
MDDVGQHEALDNALSALQARVSAALHELNTALSQDVAFHRNVIALGQQTLNESHERLETLYHGLSPSGGDEQKENIQTQIKHELRRIYAVLKRDLPRRLAHHYRRDPVVEVLNRTITQLQALPRYSEKKLLLTFHRPLTRCSRLGVRLRLIRPHRRVPIPLRVLVRQWLMRQRVDRFRLLGSKIIERRTSIMEHMNEVWHIVRYNLEGAIAELESQTQTAHDGEKSREMALGGLKRAAARLGDLVGPLIEIYGQIEQATEGMPRAILEDLQSEAATLMTWRGRWRWYTRSVVLRLSQGAREWMGRTMGRGRQSMAWVQQAHLRLMEQCRPFIERVSPFQDEPTTLWKVVDEASIETALRYQEQLPAIYRRLFNFEPLEWEELLVGREDAMMRLIDAVARWERGRSSSVLIHGEYGSGKTSVLNCAENQYPSQAPIRRVVLTEKITTEVDLMTFVASLFGWPSPPGSIEALWSQTLTDKRTIVVIEGAHNFYLRVMGGFRALRLLLLLIDRTNHHHLWILSMREHAYHYLRRLFRIGDHFTDVLAMSLLSRDELKQAILRRHHRSGFRLRFRPDDSSMRLKRKLRSVRGDVQREQALLEEYFFDRLHAVTRGNVYVAIFYWLRAVQQTIEEDVLEVAPIEPLSFPFLERLSSDYLFSVAAVLQHGELTAEQLADVLDWDLVKSQLVLEYLSEKGIICPAERNTHQPRYEINRLMLKPVLDILRQRHIIY